MKLKNLSILCATAILSMATASAELTLPINLDFEQQDIFKDLQKNKDLLVYIMPRTEATGIGVIEDPTNPSNKVLEIRSNGTSESISWLSCFNGPAPYDEKLTTAMILALHPTHDKEIAKGLTSYRYKDEFIKEYTGQGGVVPLLFDKNAHHQRIFKKEDSAFADAWVSYYNEKCKLAGYIPCKECANPKKLGGSNTIIDDVGDAEMDDGWVLVTKPKRR